MRWYVLFVCSLSFALAGISRGQRNPHIAPTDPLPAEEQLKKLHVPPGFEIQLVAAEPKIKKPINIAFDAMGRLWVTETVEYPFPAPPGKTPRDGVKILEDFAPDGRARKITTFADGLNIPIGLLPLGRGAVVFSIPNIYHLPDRDGDGRADKREVLYSGYGFKDTHGMTGEFMWGFDGWIYCCHGFANISKVKGKGPESITMQSGNTYRIKPDGSRIEYFTHGQVNPFGLAFDPLGNLYSCDCHSRPIYQLLKGAWYPSFGRQHDGLGFGPDMMTHDHGSTAIAGIAYYAANHFPAEYRDNLFIGNVVTNRINRDRIEWHGSSSKAVALPDFVKSDDPWFRPVDIKLGPDGALYVADFYNRIIGHYEVPLDHPGRDRERGRIWRIVYRGTDRGNLPPTKDLTKALTTELVAQLASANLSVRIEAANQLVARADADVIKFTQRTVQEGTPPQRAHGLWVLDRIGVLDDKTLATALENPDRLVRVHGMRLLAERPNLSDEQRRLLVRGLKDSDAFVQRNAAEALGSHPAADNLKPLLELRHVVPLVDTHLLHVVRMALRDQLRPAGTFDKIPFEGLSEKDARALADVCPGVHNAEAAGFLLRHIQRWPEPRGNLVRYAHHIARYGAAGSGKGVLEYARSKHGGDLSTQVAIFKAVQQGTQEAGTGLGDSETRWLEELAGALIASKNEKHVLAGIDFASTGKMTGMQEVLLGLVRLRTVPEAQRRSALAALGNINLKTHLGTFSGILTDSTELVSVREQAANSLGGSNVPEAHGELVKALQTAPARLEKIIALGLASSRPGAEKLLEAVAAGKASPRLLQERALEVRLQQAQVANLKERLAKLTRGLPPADQRLDELLGRKRIAFANSKSDPVKGALVFEKHCANCHQLQNKGAKIGPQIDGIGVRGLDRLLEDILDPNRNIDQAFRATSLTLKNGQLVSGLVLRQEGQVIVLADAQGKEVRVPAESVEERSISQLSPMPANFADQIMDEDFFHLLTYLLAQRVKS